MKSISSKRGQGSTEYLVILAVVLIVALVVIALLGFFPGMAGDAKETQSNSYWSGAQPFSITNVRASGTAVSMTLENRLSERLNLTSITLAGTDISVTATNFGGGEAKTVTGTLGTTCGTSGTQYQYDVVVNYAQGAISGKKQTGQKPLVGKCA